MDDKAREIVERFTEKNKRLSTQKGSFNACISASMRLSDLLKQQGIESTMIRLSDYQGDFAPAHKKWKDMGSPFYWVHYALQIGDKVVDCTARQFDANADYPLIMSLEDVFATWDDVGKMGKDGLVTKIDAPASAPAP